MVRTFMGGNMSKILKAAAIAASVGLSAPAFAQEIIVVAHGQANDRR